MSNERKKIDVTNQFLNTPALDGKLKAYDYMMRQNKGVCIEEGGYDGERTAETNKVLKERNRNVKKADR